MVEVIDRTGEQIVAPDTYERGEKLSDPMLVSRSKARYCICRVRVNSTVRWLLSSIFLDFIGAHAIFM